MLEKLKNLSLKQKIFLGMIILAALIMVVFIILYFCKVINVISLCLVMVQALFLVSLANLLSINPHEAKKLFIVEIVCTSLIFVCAVSLIVLLGLNPEVFKL